MTHVVSFDMKLKGTHSLSGSARTAAGAGQPEQEGGNFLGRAVSSGRVLRASPQPVFPAPDSRLSSADKPDHHPK